MIYIDDTNRYNIGSDDHEDWSLRVLKSLKFADVRSQELRNKKVYSNVKLECEHLSISHLSMTFGPCAVVSMVTCPIGNWFKGQTAQ